MVPGRAWEGLGGPGRIGGVPGASVGPLEAPGTSLWDPLGAFGGLPRAMPPIETHYVVTAEAMAPSPMLPILEQIIVLG